MAHIAGPCAAALASLTTKQKSFLQSLPKAELHAHLNGCIPLATLQQLASEYQGASKAVTTEDVQVDIEKLRNGVELKEIHDFFRLFGAIYALTSTPAALATATRAVLDSFLSGDENTRQCTYLELRTTPKDTEHMSRLQYLETVLDEVEKYPADQASLIVSVDRRMDKKTVGVVVELAIKLKEQGRRVVGVDLCGDPLANDVTSTFAEAFARVEAAGLGITLHIAETDKNTAEDTSQLLDLRPDRLGHATFLNEEALKHVREHKTCIEICLSSNILCKTVKSLEDHHVHSHFLHKQPVVICTDDTLPFRNSLLGEYALLLAEKPLGLGLPESEVRVLAEASLQCAFGRR